MKQTNLREALETEYGIQLIKALKDQALNKGTQFSLHGEPFSTIGEMFYEIHDIQDKAVVRGTISDEDVTLYRNHLDKLSLIMLDLLDLRHYPGSNQHYFDLLNHKGDRKTIQKIEDRINAE